MAYSETIYRTNLNTAYNAGRIRQAQDPAIAAFHPAFRYDAISDSDVRRGRPEDNNENHLALDGVIAATNHPFWSVYSPPNGFNCRCSLQMLSVFQLERMGIDPGNIPDPPAKFTASGAGFVHPSFRSNPANTLYG